MKKFYKSVQLLLMVWGILFSGITINEVRGIDISGTVKDKAGLPVVNAKLRFVNSKNAAEVFETNTDHTGYYRINNVTSAETLPAVVSSFFCYPNPFNRQTVVSFYLEERKYVEVVIYNVLGQKIRMVSKGVFEEGRHQFVWDGLSGNGAPADPGFYFCSLHTKSGLSTIKMIVQGGYNIATPVWSYGEESVPKN